MEPKNPHRILPILSLILLVAGICSTAEATDNSSPAIRRYGAQITRMAGNPPSSQGLTLSNPYWDMTLDAAGYSDYLGWFYSPRPHVQGEMLSGEWAVAVYYDGISTNPNAMWLTDYFIFPDWETNSDFEIYQNPNAWDDPCNPVVGDDTGYSAIRNAQIEVRIDYEIVDLGEQDANGVGGSPLAFRDVNGMSVFVHSERYVLLQTYTITNIDQNDINNLEFYQMLCGLTTNQSFYEIIGCNDPLSNYEPYNPVHKTGNFHYDVTQWDGDLNWIGFSSTVKPDCFDNGLYGKVHSGEGTEQRIEQRGLNGEPNSEDGGWVAGAMGWYLDSLEPNESVSITMALMLGAGPVVNYPPVELSKVDDVNDGECRGPGDLITYTIDYNYPAGPNLPDYNDVNIIDHLPAEVDFNDASGNYSRPDSNTVIWNIGTISPGDTNSFTLTVIVKCADPNGIITNECEIKSGEQLLGTAYENTSICCPTLTKVDDVNGCVGPGDYITYNICYAANGYGDTNVVIIDELPPELQFISASGNYSRPDSNTVIWDLGTLEPNESDCVALTVKVGCADPGSTITNQCIMTGDCINIYAQENTSVCSTLPTLTNIDDVNVCVGPGDYITYSIDYAAHGYGDTNVVITDELPPELEFISASGDYNQPDSNTVIWYIGTLEPNESNCVTLTVKVKCAEPNSTITNCSELTGDCITTAVTACEDTPVCGPPTLTKLEIVPNGNCVGPGDEIVYSICYAANGYGDTNVEITDDLPDDVEFVSATGDYEHVSGTVTWNVGTLGPDESGCVTLAVRVKDGIELCITITNRCEMTGDCMTTAIVACEHTPVCCPVLTKVDDVNGCVQTDDIIIYNICYTANGCSDTNVAITDFLPNEVNYITSDPCGFNDPCSGTVTWDIGTLGGDDSDCLELVVQVNTSAVPETKIKNHCLMTGDRISGIYAKRNTLVGFPGTYVCEVMADEPVLYIRFEENDPCDWSGNDYWVEANDMVRIEKTAGSLGKAAYLNYGYVAAANQKTEPNLPTKYGHQYAFAPNEITFEFWLYTPYPDSMFVYTQLFSQAESVFNGGGNSGMDQGCYAPEATMCDAIPGEQKCRMSFGYDRTPPDDFIGNFAYSSEGAWAIDTNWHHYVFIWDPLDDPCRINVKCYRDAIKYKDQTYGPPDRPDVPVLGYIGPEMDHLLIGGLGSRDTWDESIIGCDCYGCWYKNYWQYIDEFAIYPEVLDPNRIKAHYDAWWAWAKDCKELWERGLVGVQPGIDPVFAVIDLNKDCRIDFYDFAIFAEEWALCNDPAGGEGCVPNW